jgi:exodeoxyribonuclease VII small subunit
MHKRSRSVTTYWCGFVRGKSSVKSRNGRPEALEEIPFEDALRQLEAIVAKLETGSLLLEEALQAFEEGVRLARICSKRLEEGEKKISILLRSENGELVETPFEEVPEKEGEA